MAFERVRPQVNFPKLEGEVLELWERIRAFEKSVERRPKDNPFVFYEGPPTANGRPGFHHALARAFKDLIPRYKTMRGYRVERKGGWDWVGPQGPVREGPPLRGLQGNRSLPQGSNLPLLSRSGDGLRDRHRPERLRKATTGR
ncbi:MAG: class I tRNA ligase family protein [Actinobacteria bacterium]|nr:class I tRNA ligase family protein [Actinomycetota bacterium]